MYFPTSAARRLKTTPTLPVPNIDPSLEKSSAEVLCIASNHRGTLFFTLTPDGISVWRLRPCAVLAYLNRTPVSLAAHGHNAYASWSPDGTRIVIQTTHSHLVLLTLSHLPTSTSPYQSPALSTSAQRHFLPGPGEGHPLQSASLGFEGVVRIEGDVICISPRSSHIMFSTRSPSAIQRIPWPGYQPQHRNQIRHTSSEGEGNGEEVQELGHDTWLLSALPFLQDSSITIQKISYDKSTGAEGWITSDGRAYFVHLNDLSSSTAPLPNDASMSEVHIPVPPNTDEPPASPSPAAPSPPSWSGTCIYTPSATSSSEGHGNATTISINSKFTLVALGTDTGAILLSSFPLPSHPPPTPQILNLPNSSGKSNVKVKTMKWTSDGYVLAVGYSHDSDTGGGWAIWSVGGKYLGGVGSDPDENAGEGYMRSVVDLFWSPGNFELFLLAPHSISGSNDQLYSIPFAKSAITGQQSPNNTRYAFLQMDDRVLIYRGADQPDMSVINPESDVWQHVKIPIAYLAQNWAIRYAAISNDGRLVAVAGRRGLIHWSAASGRWKLWPEGEDALIVRGGMIWFHHVLVVGVEIGRAYQVRLYSRDLSLVPSQILHIENLPSPILLLSLIDNSLLVYTADNTLFHYLIVPTQDTIRLHFCGSIELDGVVSVPEAVRGMSWMVPNGQKQLGDPADDLLVATILLLVGGRLVLLKPRKVGSQEVKYDLQILADRIEFCWIHLSGIGTLENSLWGYDGAGIRVWLDALTIDEGDERQTIESVKESVYVPLEFYPLSVLMDKGIIIGAESETAGRSTLPFAMFRIQSSTHLFVHHVLQYHLGRSQVSEAVTFASHYQKLVFFAHTLEILLHTVVESEADLEEDAPNPTVTAGALPAVIEFLDHFDECLDVVVSCARKTEMKRWRRLFDIVGNPKSLFETCLSMNLLKTAGSYLLVLHNLEQLDSESNTEAVRLLQRAVAAKDWTLCKELLRFLRSIDDSGEALKSAVAKAGISDGEVAFARAVVL